VRDNSGKEHSGDEFLDTPITQTVPRCNCYKMETAPPHAESSSEIKLEDLSSVKNSDLN